MEPPKRMVTNGCLLFEYVVEEKRYILVGVIDLSAEVDEEAEVENFYKNGTVAFPVSVDPSIQWG